jgi:DNA repair exonuclease SbcCD nuclease subunit
MGDNEYRILCTGDVHLGRRPARVPVSDDALSVSHVWDRVVEAALDRAVEAVVLTGDVVDAENKMYEAYGALERGLRRLLEAKVEVVAVAGNHDHDAFPRLVRTVEDDRLNLLGPGGQWDVVSLNEEMDLPVRFVGWSFPETTVPASPLSTLSLSETEGLTVGVLHCDAGRTEGRYAPVTREALARPPVDAWLLGHIHAPTPHREADQLQLYPGSPQPLDPGEAGTHGVWEITLAPSGSVQAEQVPLASLRYDTVTVDVSPLETPGAVDSTVLPTVRDALAEAVEQWPRLRHVAYRLRLEGRTNDHRALREQADAMVNDLRVSVDTATATLEAVEFDTRPAYDLEEVAEGQDPPGVLAQLLLDLQAGRVDTERVATALRRADKAVGEVHESSGYAPLRRDSETRDRPARAELRSKLLQQGLLLLDELYARRK